MSMKCLYRQHTWSLLCFATHRANHLCISKIEVDRGTILALVFLLIRLVGFWDISSGLPVAYDIYHIVGLGFFR